MKKLLLVLPAIALLAAACGQKASDTTTSDTGITPITQMQTQQNATGSDYTPADSSSSASNSGSASNNGAGTSQNSSPAMTAAVKPFTVTGKNFSFSPSELRVKKGDTVKITFQNSGGQHDFVLDAFNAKTPVISDGKSATVEFVASKTGTFEYYCSVGNHRQMGMKGNLIVE